MSIYVVKVKVPVEYDFLLEADSEEEAILDAKTEVYNELNSIGIGECMDGCVSVGFYAGQMDCTSRSATEEESKEIEV